MPIKNKHQILAKVEESEGTAVSLAAADGLEVFNPEVSGDTDIVDRRPATSTLSRDVSPVGRQTRRVTFSSDLKGSGSNSTAPPWGALIQACAFQQLSAMKFVCTSGSGTWQAGEIITRSDSITGYGIVLKEATGSTPTVWVAWMTAAVTPVPTTVLTGATSGATASVSTETATGFCYRPTSLKSVTLTTDSWGGNAPSAGECLLVQRSGVDVGAVFVVSVTSATVYVVTPQWGDALNADVLLRSTGHSAAIAAAPVQTSTLSLTLSSNIDGIRRLMVSSRGNFSLAGAAHETPQFSWDLSGQRSSTTDAAQVTGIAASALTIPRMRGSTIGFGVSATQFRKFEIKRVELAPGNVIEISADANSSTGDRAAEVVDRDPTLTIEMAAVGVTAFDVETYLANATTLRVGFRIGSGTGNEVGFVCPKAQIVAAPDGEQAGKLTSAIQFKPRRYQGDDEIILFQIG